MTRSTAAEIGRVLELAGPLFASADSGAVEDRLAEPLRIAIAGRVKAGKSTLLNALIGERLAPTDAGECTKVVTWYRHGIQYDVTATLDDGDRRPVTFERRRDRLVIDLSDVETQRVSRLDVTWPAAQLRRFTLIDTPGLVAHDERSAALTRQLLGIGDEAHSEVDAVVYLMRHAHRLDVEFLEAFTDRTLDHPSPVNAIAVLSRADEIGAGRLDALDSARTIAQRYAADPRIRSLCATVVPVAGLIAETGRTLIESEGASLRALADLGDAETSPMVASVDRFTDPARSPLDADVRRDLLHRLGLFGVRFGIDRLRQPATTTTDLANDLVAVSGVEQLVALLEGHFARRSELLKVRSAVANVKALMAGLPSSAEVVEIVEAVDRIEAAAPELVELRLLHLMISETAGFDHDESIEVDRLIADESPAFRLGMPDEAERDELLSVIVDRLDGWRRRAVFPLASSERREASDLVAAIYEGLHAEVASG